MPSNDRRAAGRRRAWGRGPHILRFEPLEGRQLLSTSSAAVPASGAPELVATAFDTLHDMGWGDSFHAVGTIQNDGTAATTVPFNVDVYASMASTPGVDAVYVGSATIPAGLAPGASAQFNQVMEAPPIPLADLGDSASYYLDPVVDPTNAARSAPIDPTQAPAVPSSVVTVMPHAPASLVAGGFSIGTSTASWGDTITVSGHVVNDGQGSAPGTRARIVLTPQGQTPGGASDFTIGSVSVPSLSAFEGTDVSGSFAMPSNPPAILKAASNLIVTMIPDADFQTRAPLSQSSPRGLGVDSALLRMNSGPATLAPSEQPALAVTEVKVSSKSLTWGQPFQVAATVRNTGQADAGPFQVRFLLVDTNRSTAAPMAFADANLAGLKAGTSQQLTETINLQGAFPAGITPVTIAGQVVVQVDPENSVDQADRSQMSLTAGPLTVALLTNQPPSSASSSTTVTATSPASLITTATTSTATSTKASASNSATHAPRGIHAPVSAAPHPHHVPMAQAHPRKHVPTFPKAPTPRPHLRVVGAAPHPTSKPRNAG